MTISTYPYNCVCLIETSIPGAGDFRGSGVIIGPHTILTASHMLWDADANAGASTFNVYPGYNSSSDYEPSSGQIGGQSVAHYYEVNDKGGVETASASQYDFAVIDTSTNLSPYGSFGMTSNYSGGVAELTGYPADHHHIQYSSQGSVSADPDYNVWNYNTIKSEPGYSGGPIWINKGTASNPLPYVIGIASTTIHATRLTSTDLSIIKNWQASDSYLWAAGTAAANTSTASVSDQTLQISQDNLNDQTFYSNKNDIFNAGGNSNTFVFGQGFEHDEIRSFILAGPQHDTISLPSGDAARLSSIIAHGMTDAQGDTTLHLGHGDTLTLAGLSVSDLQKHKSDFTFHA